MGLLKFLRRASNPRHAGAYLRDHRFLIHAQARTTAGLYVHVPPATWFPENASDEALGNALRRCLDAFCDDLPHPVDWKGYHEPFLAAAGMRSWRSLASDARRCHVEFGKTYRFVPTRNGGMKGDQKGFSSLDALASELPSGASDDELGRQLRSAMACCAFPE